MRGEAKVMKNREIIEWVMYERWLEKERIKDFTYFNTRSIPIFGKEGINQKQCGSGG